MALAVYAIAWEAGVYEYMGWMVASRAALWAYCDLVDTFGRDCFTDLFRTKRMHRTKVEMDQEKYERYFSFGLVAQSLAYIAADIKDFMSAPSASEYFRSFTHQ